MRISPVGGEGRCSVPANRNAGGVCLGTGSKAKMEERTVKHIVQTNGKKGTGRKRKGFLGSKCVDRAYRV